MRIIAGALKGRRLTAPAWPGLRPTSDKLRETLFNILAPVIRGARVLDACAGTGALGIEAISRGARHVTFLERDPRAVALVEQNVRVCGIASGYAIIRAAVEEAGHALGTSPGPLPFDVILLDPPYDADVLRFVEPLAPWLAVTGVLVVEHARRRPVPARAGALARVRDVQSGDSALAFFETAPRVRGISTDEQ